MRSIMLTSLLPLATLACDGGSACGPGTTLEDGVCVAAEADDDSGAAATDTEDDGQGDDDDDGFDSGFAVDTAGTSSVNGAPQLLSVASNTTTLTEDQWLTVTAIVTDPDGIDDVIGGELRSGNGAASYGAFVTAAQEGAYEIMVSWDDLHTVEPIEFFLEDSRDFEVRFFDVAGNVTTAPLSLTLRCELGGACDGRCDNLLTDRNHCGACDNACPHDGGEAYCDDGTCGVWR